MRITWFGFLVICLLSLVFVINQCNASETWQTPMKDRLGLGLSANFVNLGFGPNVEYRITDNIHVSAHYMPFLDLVSIGFQADYVFNQAFEIGNSVNRPFIGLGYSIAEETNVFGNKYKGNGLELHTGLMHRASYLLDNLYVRGEFIYYTFDLKRGTRTSSLWSTFTFGIRIHYVF